MNIRPVRADDETHWRRLWTAYLEFYGAAVSEEAYASTWRRLLGNDHFDVRGLFAVADGEPIGLVHYLFHRHAWRIEDVVYLQDLYVDPAVRGRGTGRALIEAVYAAADAAGCPKVYWSTEHDNRAGRRLYDRIGRLTKFIKYER